MDDLSKYLKNASKGDNLFSNIKEISYLVKPNHLIQKPFYAAMVLIGKSLPTLEKVDFMSKDSLDKIWYKFRKELKRTDFLEDYLNFNLRKVSKDNISMVKKIYANDPWMTVNWIKRESSAALCMFQWTIKVIEYKSVLNDLLTLGIKIKEDQIEDYKKLNSKMSAIYDKFLINYAD
jgi:hypothetical protein